VKIPARKTCNYIYKLQVFPAGIFNMQYSGFETAQIIIHLLQSD